MSNDFLNTWHRATLRRDGSTTPIIVKPQRFLVDAGEPHRHVRMTTFPERAQADEVAEKDSNAALHFPPRNCPLCMNKMRLTRADLLYMRGEARHTRISLTALAVRIADLPQLVLRDLNEVNMLVTLKRKLDGFTIPSHLVNMVRANAHSNTVIGPEPDRVKRNAHQAWLSSGHASFFG
jgi:hypothetical protein